MGAPNIQDRTALQRNRIHWHPQHTTFITFDLEISCVLMERSALTCAGLLDEYLVAEEIDLVGIEQGCSYFWGSAAETKLPEFSRSCGNTGIEEEATFRIFGFIEQ